MNCSNMYREGCEEVYWQMSLLKSNYWETIGIVMRALKVQADYWHLLFQPQ